MIRIVLADDQKLMLDGLSTILQTRADYHIAGAAVDGQQALALLDDLAGAVDLVLLDVRMPVLDGVQACRRIKARWPEIRVVMLTTFNDEAYLLDALAGGADGYLLKDMDAGELFAAIDQVCQGQFVLPAQVADTLRSGLTAARRRRAAEISLRQRGFNDRELEIAGLLTDGFTNSQIASALYLSDGTVRNYVSSIYDKLRVGDRVQAILALQRMRSAGPG